MADTWGEFSNVMALGRNVLRGPQILKQSNIFSLFIKYNNDIYIVLLKPCVLLTLYGVTCKHSLAAVDTEHNSDGRYYL